MKGVKWNTYESEEFTGSEDGDTYTEYHAVLRINTFVAGSGHSEINTAQAKEHAKESARRKIARWKAAIDLFEEYEMIMKGKAK